MADDITNCRDLEARLTPFVDGEDPPAERRAVQAHLDACPPCRDHADAEAAARELVRSHREALCGHAPDSLRGRCAALASQSIEPSSVFNRPSSMRRWLPLSLAATLVLAVAGVFLFGLNDRVEALAASLAVDHVKCFKVEGKDRHADAAGAERRWQQDQGWAVTVPETAPSEQLTLVDVRRCFTTDGRSAHMMYTWRGAPLSLYVLPENVGHDRVVDRMGHEAVIWCANSRTYAVVADGHPQDLTHIVDYLKAHAR